MDPAQTRVAHPRIARDLALRRATRLSKWAGVAALALTGALAGFVAQAKPGHSVSTNPRGAGGGNGSGVASSTGSSQPSGNATGSGGGANATLSPPPAAPVPAPAPSPPTVVSGGS